MSFAALAVVIALYGHAHTTATGAATTLIITVLGTLVAVFTADVASHIVSHGRLFTPIELRQALSTSFGSINTVILPLVFLSLAALGVWHTDTALRASAIALLVSLVVVGIVAVRRIPLSLPQKLVILGAEAALGILVIGLQVVAHG